MEDILHVGFLGTKAPLFMDIFVVAMVLLPFFVAFAIWLAIREYHSIHHTIQVYLFWITLLILLYAIYNIFLLLGIKGYINHINLAFNSFIFYIFVSSISMVIWYRTIKFAKEDKIRRALPGLYSSSHKRAGRLSAIFILLISILTPLLYWVIFIF